MSVVKVLVFALLYFNSANGEILDMTYEFRPNVTLYWPGNTEFKYDNEFRGEYTASNGVKIWMEAEDIGAATHGGTHLDAPSHITDKYDTELWTADEIPAHRLMGPLRVIDISGKTATGDRNYQLSVADIAAHELKYGRIPKGAIVLMNSGWGSKWPNKTAYLGENYAERKLNFPGISDDAAKWLSMMRDIYGVGVDTPSLDYGLSLDFPSHRVFFQNNVYGLENVANVDKVPEAGATVFAFPMKNVGASGAPCRIVAVWGDSRTMISSADGMVRLSVPSLGFISMVAIAFVI